MALRFFAFSIMYSAFIACKSTEPLEPATISHEISIVPNLEIDEQEPADIQYSRRFCQDDVYSRYIQNHYLSQKMGLPLKPEKLNRVLRTEAEQEAFTKLNIQLPVMFDGFPIEATPRIYAWIQYFTGNGRMEFLKWLVRSESYRPLLLPLLEQEGLPPEFIFLAMIESGFSNTAFSRSAASGTWQFMRQTAQHYGLQINYWVDERRDPVKSTLAAARYLKDLHKQFQNWYLAIAAYNAGPGKIRRAMQIAKSRDYWVISKTPYLLAETKNYVPKLLAALVIASHPENYGFSVTQDLRNSIPLSTIALERPYRLVEISDRLNIPHKALQRWNPEIIRGVTPPLSHKNPSAYPLRLPQLFNQQFAAIESNFSRLSIQDVRMHKIQKGETLDNIAKHYQISIKDIMHYNPALKPQKLKPGRTIAVPMTFFKTGMLN